MMVTRDGNPSYSDEQFHSRLLQWMKAQPVLMSLILEAKQRWYYPDEEITRNESSNKFSDIRNNEASHPFDHTIKIERFGYGQSNPTYLVSVLPCDSMSVVHHTNNHTQRMDDNDKLPQNQLHIQPHEYHHQHHATTTSRQVELPLITQFVLRSKPKSVIHTSAHAIHREYAILSAIHQYNRDIVTHRSVRNDTLIVPVPEVYVYCHDTSIMGASFYMMEFMNGRICTDPSLQDHFATPLERQQAYEHVAHVLALIHIIDLSKYMDYDMLLHGGTSGDNPKNVTVSRSRDAAANTSTTNKLNFVERQLVQLANVSQRQSLALERHGNSQHSAGANISKMMRQLDPIRKGLQSYAPYCPGSSRQDRSNHAETFPSPPPTTASGKGTMLIHGDYKIDNIIFHPTLPKVIAIIDWELASIHNDGVDPYCDIANLCMMYFIPKQTGNTKSNDSNTTVITGIANYTNHEIQKLGVPLREELIQTYCNERDHLLATFDSLPSLSINSSLRHHSKTIVYDWSGYYLTFLFFKNCIILQGVLQRTLQSTSIVDRINSRSDATKNNTQEEIIVKKTQLLLRLLPITIHLTAKIWKTYPPPSLCNIAPSSGHVCSL